MSLKLRTTVSIFIIAISGRVNSQGCSDAGICSIGGLKQHHSDTMSWVKNSVNVGLGYGLAQYEVNILNGLLEYSHHFSAHFTVSAKATYSLLSGPVATNSGLSDFYLTAQYKFSSNISPVLGIKLPFTHSDKSWRNKPLPMSYQTSLGTADLLAGISLTRKKWTFSMGIQYPFVQNNNAFSKAKYDTTSIDNRYIDTRGYTRKPDAMFRAYYYWQLKSPDWEVIPGVLFIFHSANDTYEDNNSNSVEILKSKGLTVNLNAQITYRIHTSGKLKLVLGAPIVSRKSRPEGLSQATIQFEYAAQL